MGDMSRCKHGSHQGYCDECSPGWEIELIKADAADKIYARGVEKGKEEAAYEIDRLRAEVASLKEERDGLRRKVYTNTDNGMTMESRIFSVDGDGYIQDNNFDYDAGMKLSGDFGDAETKQQYAQMICDTLNSHCTLTQQLAAAKEYAERLREALETCERMTEHTNDGISYEACRAALALQKPWEKA